MKCLGCTITLILTISIIVADQTALDEFTTGNQLFTARLYKEVLKQIPSTNFVFSPLSVEIILALTQAGAIGETAAEFVNALNLPSSLEKTQQALEALLPQLQTKQDDLSLQSANKLYIGNGLEILPDFKKLATTVFQSDIENVDFGQREKAASTINHWVEERTNNKIKNLVNPDSLSILTRLVLVNALYFSGKWRTSFEKYMTSKEKFYISNTETKNVDMMHVQGDFRYYECTKRNAKFLELPYIGENITMTIVLPNDKEGLTALENNIEDLLKPPPFSYESVDVSIPRWLVETSVDLAPILKQLGLRIAFTDNANFSKITNEPIHIDKVIQKAFINVTESGTEAAAATAGFMTRNLIYENNGSMLFTANHPFSFVISYYDTVIFAGMIFG